MELVNSLILVRPEGVYVPVVTTGIDRNRLFEDVNVLFSSGYCLKGLNYPLFLDALYCPEKLEDRKNTPVRLADELASMSPERMALYRDVKISVEGEEAEYFFEPVYPESPDGESDHAPVQLDFDEFVAVMWRKNVRFGLQEEAVREIIRHGLVQRAVVAKMRPPGESRDACVVEVSEKMHQDRSPLILPDGRTDMRRARNHFPHVSNKEILLRKIPRHMGEYGYRVTGRPMPPETPKDLDLHQLAGAGTCVLDNDQGEFLQAIMDGFVTIQPGTHAVQISATLENRTGISIRNTGDLQLQVKDFKEYGEVQEGRVIEGQNMHFQSPVYGTVISREGDLNLDKGLSGGEARALKGHIHIQGNAVSSLIEARSGTVTLSYAEDCAIIAEHVVIERAVNCDILCDRLLAQRAEGCMIAGRQLDLHVLASNRYHESTVFILLPDTDEIEGQLAGEQEQLQDTEQLLQQQLENILKEHPDPVMEKYIRLRDGLQAGQVTLSDTDFKAMEQLNRKFSPVLAPRFTLQEKRRQQLDAIEKLKAKRLACNTDEYCNIKSIKEHVRVDLLRSNRGMAHFFPQSNRREIKAMLRQLAARGGVHHQADQGSYHWTYRSVWEQDA